MAEQYKEVEQRQSMEKIGRTVAAQYKDGGTLAEHGSNSGRAVRMKLEQRQGVYRILENGAK